MLNIDSKLNIVGNVTRQELLKYPNNFVSLEQRLKRKVKFLLKIEPKLDKFSWPNAFLSQALEYSHESTKEDEYLNVLINYYTNWIEDGSKLKILDHAMNGYSLIYVYELTNEEKYLKLLEKIANYLYKHVKDHIGSLPYRPKGSNKTHIYIDSLGMICPFLCRYTALVKESKYAELAVVQLTNYLECGMDIHSNLPYHGYDSISRDKLGIIGWGRAVGWMLIGLTDTLEYLTPNHLMYVFLKEELIKLIDTVLQYQKDNGSFSWQIEAFEGPSDSSATGMIGYSIMKAVYIGLISEKYCLEIEGMINYFYSVSEKGYINHSSAECRGMGMYPQVYGWYPWSQGPVNSILALYKLYYKDFNRDSKS